jgi:hypothetical protein
MKIDARQAIIICIATHLIGNLTIGDHLIGAHIGKGELIYVLVLGHAVSLPVIIVLVQAQVIIRVVMMSILELVSDYHQS